MNTQQPDDPHPDQPVQVSPVYLAGIGDTATIYDPLDDTRGWGKAITDGGLCFTSPRLDTHLAHLPESRYGGWRITRFHEPFGMPDWSVTFSRRNFEVDDNAELQGDYPTRWTMYACVEKAAGPRWHATFTERVPLYLVTTAVSAFSSSEPVERPRSGIPERNLPYLTTEPARERDSDRLRSAALSRTLHALPATAPAPPADATAPGPTPPVPFRRR